MLSFCLTKHNHTIIGEQHTGLYSGVLALPKESILRQKEAFDGKCRQGGASLYLPRDHQMPGSFQGMLLQSYHKTWPLLSIRKKTGNRRDFRLQIQ